MTHKNRQKLSVPRVVYIFSFSIWILGISLALLNESSIFRLSKTGEESKPTEIFSGDVIRLDRHYPNQIFFYGDVIRFHHYPSQIFSSVIIRTDRPYPNPYIFLRWRHQARSPLSKPKIFLQWLHQVRMPLSKPNIFLRWRHQVDRHYPHQIFLWWHHQIRSSLSKPNIFLRWRHQVRSPLAIPLHHYPSQIFFFGDLIRLEPPLSTPIFFPLTSSGYGAMNQTKYFSPVTSSGFPIIQAKYFPRWSSS